MEERGWKMGSEWTSATIGEHFDLVNGYAFKSKDFTEKGVPVIKIKNIKAGYFSEHHFSYVLPKFLESQEDKIAQSNDLLISMSGNRHDGSPETWVGKVAHFKKTKNYLINQRVGALRLKKEGTLDARFMGYLLSSWKYQEQFIAIATSSGGQANLSPKQIFGTTFEYPDLPEQRAIAHILGSLDDKIELNRKTNETLEAMARAVFKSWFVDFDPVRAKAEGRDPVRARRGESGFAPNLPPEILNLFPDSFIDSELGQIPKGWEIKTIGEVVEFAYGKALKASNRKTGTVPVFGSNGPVGLHNEALVKGPGIVIGRKGNPGIVTWSSKDFFPIDTTFYVKKIGNISSLIYLFYALKDQDLPSLSADSAVPGLNRNMAYMNNILVPSDKVLSAFDEQVVPLFKKIDVNDDESVTLAALRDTLLPKLISGELRVPDAEKFVEEVGL